MRPTPVAHRCLRWMAHLHQHWIVGLEQTPHEQGQPITLRHEVRVAGVQAKVYAKGDQFLGQHRLQTECMQPTASDVVPPPRSHHTTQHSQQGSG